MILKNTTITSILQQCDFSLSSPHQYDLWALDVLRRRRGECLSLQGDRVTDNGGLKNGYLFRGACELHVNHKWQSGKVSSGYNLHRAHKSGLDMRHLPFFHSTTTQQVPKAQSICRQAHCKYVIRKKRHWISPSHIHLCLSAAVFAKNCKHNRHNLYYESQ